MKLYNVKAWLISVITIAVSLILVLLLMFGINSCTQKSWNEGTCPYCEVKYELRAVSRGLKYYVCPDCGYEIERY